MYIIPTKKGLGVELWGTNDDMANLYDVVGKFWNDENKQQDKVFQNRDSILSSFSYEIRKAESGQRLKRESSHFSFEKQPHMGLQMSWVHFLFALTALKTNMRHYETTKFDISQILLIEFWLEKAMYSYDAVGAIKLVAFIEGGLFGGNKMLYQYMRSINLSFLSLGGGQKAFRKLPELMRSGVYGTKEYEDYMAFLQKEATRLNCDISELELSDNDFDYDGLKW